MILIVFILHLQHNYNEMSLPKPMSPEAETFCKLVFTETPVMIQHPSGHFDMINPQWAPYIKERRVSRRFLTDLGVRVMHERNDRGQPMIYVGFRFCKDLNFHLAVLCTKARAELMNLRTEKDGSTPLIGWAWENRSSRFYTDPKVVFMKEVIYDKTWWDVTNDNGESAGELILPAF